jgi:hypothetical protein
LLAWLNILLSQNAKVSPGFGFLASFSLDRGRRGQDNLAAIAGFGPYFQRAAKVGHAFLDAEQAKAAFAFRGPW